MLGKLLKYEIKATGRMFLPLFLALLISAGITKFLYTLAPDQGFIPANLSMMIYIIIMVGMFVMTFVMMVQRFYKNLFSDEGYLMLTLPVKPWMHIVCKLLVSMLWMMTSGIVALISILIFLAFDHGNIIVITERLLMLFNQAFQQVGSSAYFLTVEIILSILVSLATGILIVYASIAIGHLFNKHKMLASFGAFLVLNTLSQIVFILMSKISGNAYFSNINVTPNNFMDMQTIIQLVIVYGIVFTGLLSAAYFAITNYILSKRLNLE